MSEMAPSYAELKLSEDECVQLRAEIKRLGHERAECQLVMDCQESEIERLRAALILVRGIIVNGAETGFNCHDGDWAERLFASQGATHAALNKISS